MFATRPGPKYRFATVAVCIPAIDNVVKSKIETHINDNIVVQTTINYSSPTGV